MADKTINTLIVDDERLARDELRELLSEHSDIQVIAEAGNADEAMARIEDCQPDLIFLDIQMPGKSGFELLAQLGPGPLVIFVTAYDEYAVRAFETSAIDYLLKPVEPARLAKALKRARIDYHSRSFSEAPLAAEDKVFLKDGERCWYLPLSDIGLMESVGNYTQIRLSDGKPLIRRSLNQLESRLPPALFFRASRQHIVNLAHVERVDTAVNGNLELVLRDGRAVELSRRQSQLFRESQSL
ncbi:LytTR family DNA-binding domain-containing protein [Gilvimarinus sp. DA14]|uniref:LytR/AlgR family response regulator transcription factor n=1 Tax=Gilvimarinus sp. DA14 TaxID=2956798 RepID=UPI0020B6F8B7|nr:response regulator [Gilvimarinus sp. DA14]UTF58796.1 response regulator [Gilvimarinus sp. DA14]